MKETKTIKLLSHDISLIIEKPNQWADGAMGRADLKKLTMRINSEMPHSAQSYTIIHELLHLISDFHSVEITEQQIDAIAVGVCAFIRDNKDLVAYM